MVITKGLGLEDVRVLWLKEVATIKVNLLLISSSALWESYHTHPRYIVDLLRELGQQVPATIAPIAAPFSKGSAVINY